MKHFTYTVRIPIKYDRDKAIIKYDLSVIQDEIIGAGYQIYDYKPIFSLDKEFQYISYRVSQNVEWDRVRNERRAEVTKALFDYLQPV